MKAKMWNSDTAKTREMRVLISDRMKNYKDTDVVSDELNKAEASKALKEGYRYYLTGNTYPIKELLKKAHCEWEPVYKKWSTVDYFWRGLALQNAKTEEEKEMIKAIKVEIVAM